MEEMINGLIAKCGIDRATAEKVVGFLKENAHRVPEWIASNEAAKGLVDKLPGGLAGMFGKH